MIDPDGTPLANSLDQLALGIFFRFGASDGKVNPVTYAYDVGLSGNGIVPGRPADSFGIGRSRTELSHDLFPVLRRRLDIGLEREDAVELYDNAAVAKSTGVRLDLQVVVPSLSKRLSGGF